MHPVDLSKLTPVDELEGDDWEETEGLKELVDRAEQFVSAFSWAGNVLQVFAGPVVPPIVGTFLFRLDPVKTDVDEWLWVVVGDIPPAYLVTDEARDGIAALELYVSLMNEWVDAVIEGKQVDDFIPVDVPPTKPNAEMLRSRLTFLSDRLIPELRSLQ